MKIRFPAAPTSLPSEMMQLVVHLAQAWANYSDRPKPRPNVLTHWDELIESWAEDTSLPLFVRKHENNRGSVIAHSSGRQVVPTDNSPAQWAFALAVLGETPTLAEIRNLITADAVPVAMVFKRVERLTARFKCNLRRVINPNDAGWKVAHIEGVGLSTNFSLVNFSETQLLQHFQRLMAPRNMFVVPKKYAGLGELPEFCEEMRKLAE
jgi:hypothetical protein